MTDSLANSLVDKGDDAEETDEGRARRRHRKRVTLIGVAVVVALVGAGLLIARPWSDDAADAPESAAASTVPGSTGSTDEAGEPTLSNHLVLGDFGPELTVQWANDGTVGMNDMGAPTGQRATAMLAAEGADQDGPWLAAGVELLDRFDRKSFDPAAYFGDPSGRKVMVGDVPGYYVESGWTGSQVLVFGPVNDGFAVSFNAAGISQADMIATAEELVLEEDSDQALARPVFGPKAAELGLRPIAAFVQDTWGFGGPAMMGVTSGFTPSSSVVSYTTADGHNLTVTNDVAPTGLDLLAVARVMLADVKAVTVHGLPAIEGGDQFSGDAVVWVEGGRTISVTGDVDDLLAAAESVEVADDSAWGEVLSAAEANMGNPGAMVTESWLIGAGDLDDSTTWILEGGLDDNGLLVLCSAVFANDGSSMNGCNGSHEISEPSLFRSDSLGMNGDQGLGLVATVPNTFTGAVLRFTADDGTVSEVPLKEVRAEWSFVAAALAVSTEGTAVLVAADGSELATLEITDDELGGIGDGGVVTTAAAAEVVVASGSNGGGAPDTTVGG